MFCQPFFLFFRSCFTYHTDNYKMCSLETEAGINAIELGKGLLNYEALFHLIREREPVIIFGRYTGTFYHRMHRIFKAKI